MYPLIVTANVLGYVLKALSHHKAPRSENVTGLEINKITLFDGYLINIL